MGMHAGNGVGLQNKLTKVCDVEDLHKRIIQAWNDLDQRIIDSAVREWHKPLRACVHVEAEGGQFEHKL